MSTATWTATFNLKVVCEFGKSQMSLTLIHCRFHDINNGIFYKRWIYYVKIGCFYDTVVGKKTIRFPQAV